MAFVAVIVDIDVVEVFIEMLVVIVDETDI